MFGNSCWEYTLQVQGCVEATVEVEGLAVTHQFIVVKELICEVILGLDFLVHHKVVVDFSTNPVKITETHTNMGDLKPIVENNKSVKAKILAVAALDNVDVDTIDNCLVPEFREKEKFELPDSKYSVLRNLLHKYKALFSTIPGRTDQAYHYISTTGPPVRVPPRRIPVHFREEIEQQLQTMLELGIIEKSNSRHQLYLFQKSRGKYECV